MKTGNKWRKQTLNSIRRSSAYSIIYIWISVINSFSSITYSVHRNNFFLSGSLSKETHGHGHITAAAAATITDLVENLRIRNSRVSLSKVLGERAESAWKLGIRKF